MTKKIVSILLVICLCFGLNVTSFAEGEEPPVEPQPIDLSECSVTVSKAEYTYTGAKIEPTVTVKYETTKYVLDTDYTVKYYNNKEAGTATVKVTAVANSTVLAGNKEINFKIVAKDISKLSNKYLSEVNYIYDGSAHKPEITFGDEIYKPKANTDYTISYKSNVNIGKATATIKGKGNYKGSFTKTFRIYPDVVKNLKVRKLTDKTFTLSWDKVSGGVTYRLYRKNTKNDSYTLAVTTKNSYFNVSGRTPATTYTYMVRAYKRVSGKNYLSNESVAKKVTMKPEKVTVLGGAFKGKKFKAKWKKITASGYQIAYSRNKKFKKGVKTIDVNKGSAKSKKFKLNSKKKYYFRIRAYLNVNGKRLYGKWSDKKTTRFNNVYSSFTTYFSSPYGRTTNIKRACKYIDGTILNPGDRFSFNGVVGPRTADRGFKMATVYSGQTVTEGLGGGVCQVSTTIFNAALLANLAINERCQHTMKVHYVVPGRDAAISWGTCDLKFTNNTNETIKISAKVYNNSQIVIKLLTNAEKKHKKVKLSVSRSGSTYKLTRTVGGKVNYTTYSTY